VPNVIILWLNDKIIVIRIF